MEKKRVEVDRLIKKARSSWWEDGIVELFTGMALIIISALGILSSVSGGSLSYIFSIAWILSLIVFILSGQKIIKFLKRKLVWSRIGYAKPAKERATFKNGKWTIGAFVCMLGSIILYTHPISSLLMSCFVSGIFMSIFEYSGLTRFAIIGLLNLVTGVTLFILGFKVNTGVFINLSVTGILLLLTGIMTWNQFQRRRTVNG